MLSSNCPSLPLHRLCLFHLYAALKLVVPMLSYVKKCSNTMSPTIDLAVK